MVPSAPRENLQLGYPIPKMNLASSDIRSRFRGNIETRRAAEPTWETLLAGRFGNGLQLVAACEE
jgi:hypothetical protein